MHFTVSLLSEAMLRQFINQYQNMFIIYDISLHAQNQNVKVSIEFRGRIPKMTKRHTIQIDFKCRAVIKQ